MGVEIDLGGMTAAYEAKKATDAAAAQAAAATETAKQAAEAKKQADQAAWNLNHPTRYSFAGDTVMTLGMTSTKAKKMLLGE